MSSNSFKNGVKTDAPDDTDPGQPFVRELSAECWKQAAANNNN